MPANNYVKGVVHHDPGNAPKVVLHMIEPIDDRKPGIVELTRRKIEEWGVAKVMELRRPAPGTGYYHPTFTVSIHRYVPGCDMPEIGADL
jgi:hypothetical protein